MTSWQRISQWVAQVGQSIQFVAFWAHFAAAGWFVSMWHKWYVAVAVIVLAAVKEFWFDATYETDPPQTFGDNLEDWLGWTLGVVAGVLIGGLRG